MSFSVSVPLMKLLLKSSLLQKFNFWSKEKMNIQHKINPTVFVHNSNYICFFRNLMCLWQKYVKQNGVSYNTNAAISHKCHSVTFSDKITSRKNDKNLIVQIHNFIIENDTHNLKFTMFHAHDMWCVARFGSICTI